MNEIKIFENEQFGQIRTIGTPDEPLFCAMDVCRALKYSNGRKAVIDHVDEKDVTKRDTLTKGGTQSLSYVNESGLYALIFGSKLESAKEFKRWVTSEVLPTIRKHGAYMTNDVIERTLTDPDYLIKLATELKNEKQKRLLAEQTVEKQQAVIIEQQPKVEFYDAVTKSKGSESFKIVAQSLKNKVLRVPVFGQNKLIDILREMKIIYGKGNGIYPYQNYINDGCFEVVNYPFKDKNGRPHIGHKTLITQRGKQFVAKVVKQYYYDMNPNKPRQLFLFDI